jgi:hypothetical protein
MADSYCRGARSGLAKQDKNNQGGALDDLLAKPSGRRRAVAPSRGADLMDPATAKQQQQQKARQMTSADDLARQRRERDREKLQRDEAKKTDYLEKQKLLNMIEAPLISLLERLGVREELSLALANENVTSLAALRACDHEVLATKLTNRLLQDKLLTASVAKRPPGWMQDTMSTAVDMARRDLAMHAINALMLPEDYVYQDLARQKMLQQEKASRAAEDQHARNNSYTMPKNTLREEDIVALRDKDGALRKELLAVTTHWQDFIQSQPAFAARLQEEGGEGPSWKDTVSWSLWMLTRPLQDAEKGTSRGSLVFMTKPAIERALRYAKDYVYYALYPQMKEKSTGEWRLYWVRVFTNFGAFYSEKGRQRWMDVAAFAARATALRKGKSLAEQDTAVAEAMRNVCSMLRKHQVSRPREPWLPENLRATPRASTARGNSSRGSGHLITQSSANSVKKNKGDSSSRSRTPPETPPGQTGDSSSRARRTLSAPPERPFAKAASSPFISGVRSQEVSSSSRTAATALSPAAGPPSHRRSGPDRPTSGGFPAAATLSTAPLSSHRDRMTRRSKSPRSPTKRSSPRS